MSMKMQLSFSSTSKSLHLGLCALLSVTLMGCSFLDSKTAKPKPAELGVNIPLIGISQVWSAQLSATNSLPLGMHVKDFTVIVATIDGTVAAIDSRTGSDLWRTRLNVALSSGAGSDGRWTAVVSQGNELIVMEEGREKWREAIPAQVFTTPLVAGSRVFVLAADRTLLAFDAASGRRLWTQPRSGDALVLRHPGVLMAVGNSLVAGISGKLVEINPDTGLIRWESPIGSARGTNDVERLVELVAPASRAGYSVCARAFQAGVGCIDVRNASVQWVHKSGGVQGVGGDSNFVYGTQSNGGVTAWRRNDGEQVWNTERLAYRQLTAPLLVGRSLVVGDEKGVVHLLSSENGSPLNRLETDGSGIVTSPANASNTLVVLTRKGRMYAFRFANEN